MCRVVTKLLCWTLARSEARRNGLIVAALPPANAIIDVRTAEKAVTATAVDPGEPPRELRNASHEAGHDTVSAAIPE